MSTSRDTSIPVIGASVATWPRWTCCVQHFSGAKEAGYVDYHREFATEEEARLHMNATMLDDNVKITCVVMCRDEYNHHNKLVCASADIPYGCSLLLPNGKDKHR